MPNKPIPADIRISGGPQFGEAMACLVRAVVEGLNHGFFECSITGEVVSGGKRQMMIRAGKSHKFTFPEDELPR